jgi:F0F1-type ATP synthase assembly protein I
VVVVIVPGMFSDIFAGINPIVIIGGTLLLITAVRWACYRRR